MEPHPTVAARRANPTNAHNPADAHAAADPSRAPRAEYELVPELPPPPRTKTIQVLPQDKALFDALQSWWSFRRGRRLSQWEFFTVLLAEALEHRGGRFAQVDLQEVAEA